MRIETERKLKIQNLPRSATLTDKKENLWKWTKPLVQISEMGPFVGREATTAIWFFEECFWGSNFVLFAIAAAALNRRIHSKFRV